MSRTHFGMVGALVVVVVVTSRVPGAAVGLAQPAEADAYVSARTPWGDPDLQGIWSAGYIMTRLERPDEYEGREFLTDEEVAALESGASATFGIGSGALPSTAGRPETAEADLQGAYNDVYSGRGTQVIATKRTSSIVDPPDGKIPYTPEAAERLAAEAAARRATRVRAHGPEDRLTDRCLGVSLPFRFGVAGASGAHTRMVQTPGQVAIYYEQGHKGGIYRSIFLDGRPRLPSQFRQWLGHATGRWEGDTLVVDTTNFSQKTDYQGSRENLHLVERYTPTGPDAIMYHATFEDPTVFARAWTIEVPLTRNDNKKNQIYEAACHEGNYALTGILAGARALERRVEELRRFIDDQTKEG